MTGNKGYFQIKEKLDESIIHATAAFLKSGYWKSWNRKEGFWRKSAATKTTFGFKRREKDKSSWGNACHCIILPQEASLLLQDQNEAHHRNKGKGMRRNVEMRILINFVIVKWQCGHKLELQMCVQSEQGAEDGGCAMNPSGCHDAC